MIMNLSSLSDHYEVTIITSH